MKVSALNPVSHGLHIGWQSTLVLPFFLFHFLRFAVLDPKLLSALLVLILFRKLLWREHSGVVSLLVILIPLGFFMPVLYSPAWYPLALSFYAPLVSVQAALLLVAVGFGVFAHHQVSRLLKTVIGLVGLIFLMGVALQAHFIMRDDNAKPAIVSASLVQAMNFLATTAKDSDVVLTHRFDLDTVGDESYYWYSALSGRAVISEGAKYGSLLAAVADTNSEKGLHPAIAAARLLAVRRKAIDTVYQSDDPAQVLSAVMGSRATYIVEGPSQNERLVVNPGLAGQQVFGNSDYTIWKVR